MSKTYSAGIVTAYGAAKRAGYQGTYEDFCRQQAGYAESAATVEQAKQDAQTARDQAQTARAEAVSAKDNAVSAKDDAVSAKNTAVSAKDDAVSAKNTASTKAQEASASATSAGQSAQSANQSARSAEQSAQDISGNLEQIQTNTRDIGLLKADLADKSDTADMLKAFPTDTASGAVASFTDGADSIPVKSLVVGIEPAQSGSGDPSPTNVRPISGWTGVEVTVSPTTDAEDGDTYDIAFPSEAGTVYGGTLNVTTGVLTVNSDIVDMGTLNWTYNSARQRIVAQVNSGKPAGGNFGLDGACSVYKVINTAYQQAPDKSIVIGNNFISNSYAAMVVHDEDYTDAETFKTAVSGHTLVYPIRTPVTYQLTPTEVTTLLGTNNIWADAGDCTVEYRADTKLYVDRVYVDYRTMLAPVESTYIATRNYTTGQLLIVGNTLYKVTASIANGGTITPNSNVTATTLLADLGDKSNLKTLDKTNIVSAINSLNSIVRVIANRDTSWAGIKENVKSGYGEILYPVGTDFSVSCPSGAPYNDIVFTVVNHRIESGEPIMTLLMKRCIYNIQFDATQAAFVASEAMAAGTYHFKLLEGYDTGYDGGKYVQFTIVNPLVAGDQIVITWGYNQSWIGKNAYVYHAFDTTPVETCVMSEGQGGTYLGVADGSSANLNHTHRLRYGSNNWKESAVREWLNSDARAGEWQTQQTRFQRPCSCASSNAGFISYLDPSFVAAIRTGEHLNRTNQVFDLLGTKVAYSTEERFFLLSNEEIGFTSESGIVCGSLFSFYDGADNADRIKYDITNENTARYWWLRTPNPSSAGDERIVLRSGAFNSDYASHAHYGAAAACEI